MAGLVQYVNLVLFGGLALVCVRTAVRRKTSAARWAAISFGLLGAISLVGLVFPEDPMGFVEEAALRVLIVALLMCPYALYRFSATFEALPRLADRLAVAATIALSLATLALPDFPTEDEARPAWFEAYLIAFLLDWFALSVIVARRLWRAGRGQPSVSRYRMRTLALGALGLALALLPGIAPAEDQPTAVRVASDVLPVVSAALFYVGFAPPAFLRALWRRPEQAALQRLLIDIMRAPGRSRVLATVLPHAAALVGGTTATFVDGREAHGPVAAETGSDEVVRLPLGAGTLVVEAGPYAPFFGDDEIQTLQTLAGFVELVLERTTLLESEREARTEAERTSKELETLVYGISHDLKSPIISLLGYLGYLREDYGAQLGDEAKHYLDRMESSAVYMQDLLTDLLELSRVGRVNVEVADVDFGAVFADVGLDVAARFPRVTVAVGSVPPVAMNAARARQLATNLIENAARHGGRDDITITVSGRVDDRGATVLSVSDNGVGIPAEYREKAFGIFERLAARDAASGTGIGLALCRRIVETAGGEIVLVDAPAGAGAGSHPGTHVQIVLPPRAGHPALRQNAEVSA